MCTESHDRPQSLFRLINIVAHFSIFTKHISWQSWQLLKQCWAIFKTTDNLRKSLSNLDGIQPPFKQPDTIYPPKISTSNINGQSCGGRRWRRRKAKGYGTTDFHTVFHYFEPRIFHAPIQKAEGPTNY
jgi:hypothetical protein